jgi:hypothetical protein
MNSPKNLLEAYEGYISYIHTHYPSKRAKSLTQEVWFMMQGGVVIGLGYPRSSKGTRTNPADRESIKAFMAAQPTDILIEARVVLQRGFEKIPRTDRSQYNLVHTLEQFLGWCLQQSWWMGEIIHPDQIADLCCSNLTSTHKNRKQHHQTHRRGARKKYALSNEDICPSLREELDALYTFLTAPEYPERVIPPVSSSTAKKNYIKDLLLILGWFCYKRHVPPNELSFNLLIPKLEQLSLRGVSKSHKKLWREEAVRTEDWIQQYFDFLREEMDAVSPRTFRSKLAALSALGKFQYRSDVDAASDYKEIPVLKVILKLLQDNGSEVRRWNNGHRYVADQEMKWPDTVPGETALTTVRREILDVLQLEARPKSKRNQTREGSAIALSQQRYIAWYLLAGLPPRRQEEYRELRIALTCPVQRPQSVPPNGCYHPLPPKEVREQRHDGLIQDNYLHKTYTYQGKHYKDGIWLLDIHDHKMQDRYGPQSIVIKNRQFSDGSNLYEYLEHYLYGWWLPGGRKQQHIYDWWQQDLQGRRGRWASTGRASLGASQVYQTSLHGNDFWCWGYFFIQPRVGTQYRGDRFSEMVEAVAYRCIGKRINPHHMRAIWATWAYQMELSDRQKESLAYAMGHDVKTLEELYNRASPAEKRRPIEECIRKEFLTDLQLNSTPQLTEAQTLEKKLKNLSRAHRKQLAALLQQQKRTTTPSSHGL